jgi:hypothetical protein
MGFTLAARAGAGIFLAAWFVAVHAQQPFDPQGRPNRSQPGPWNNDILVFRVGADGRSDRLFTFERAGVSTLGRLADGRLIAAHQHFPDDNDADFDKVAVHFSQDEGRSWTRAEVIRVVGLTGDMRFPFDPTLVPLPGGRVRLYFTSVRRVPGSRPAIYSAISSNGVDFVVEPGVRFAIEGRPVIDSAVVLHRGVFHLFSPDNGSGPMPGPGGPAPDADRPRDGIGYHATSPDGLTFTRQDDVRVDGRRRWLGSAQSDGAVIMFFGTGEGGVWTATSPDGQAWQLDSTPIRVPGADPGAVRLRDGGWLLSVTGPPRVR